MADQSVEQGSANRADGDNAVGIVRLDYAEELLNQKLLEVAEAAEVVHRLAGEDAPATCVRAHEIALHARSEASFWKRCRTVDEERKGVV